MRYTIGTWGLGATLIVLSSMFFLITSCTGNSPQISYTASAQDNSDIAVVPTATVAISSSIVGPTLTSIPPVTEVSEEDYPITVYPRIAKLQDQIGGFSGRFFEMQFDVTMAGPDRVLGTKILFSEIETGVHEIKAMKNFPPEFQDFYDVWLQLDKEIELMSPDIYQALDNQDAEAVKRATPHEAKLIPLIHEASQKFIEIWEPR